MARSALSLIALLFAAGCAEQPLGAALRLQHLEADLAQARRTPPLPSPLSLEQAVAYALEHNLALWAMAQEREIQEEMINRTRLDMLPSLLAEAEASRRSDPHAAYSEDVESGRRSSRATFSADPRSRRLDLTAVWHLLDFGLTFLRAQQAAEASDPSVKARLAALWP
ncbi:MAG: TolC family protein, partial [Planctomycetota bacterium]|nr:TolC family protein [Planctomycetota bacterium]